MISEYHNDKPTEIKKVCMVKREKWKYQVNCYSFVKN